MYISIDGVRKAAAWRHQFTPESLSHVTPDLKEMIASSFTRRKSKPCCAYVGSHTF